jgi:hypothetical protein
MIMMTRMYLLMLAIVAICIGNGNGAILCYGGRFLGPLNSITWAQPSCGTSCSRSTRMSMRKLPTTISWNTGFEGIQYAQWFDPNLSYSH